MASEAPGEAATSATQHAGNTRLTSAVWDYFIYNASDSNTGGRGATATCRKCGATLCAGGKKGTSHLRRHINSERCRARAEERLRQLVAPTAVEASPGHQEYYCMSKVDDADADERLRQLAAPNAAEPSPGDQEYYCMSKVDDAKERLRQLTVPTAAEPSPGDQEYYRSSKVGDEYDGDGDAFFIVDGMNIPDLFDDLHAKVLVYIDQKSEAVGAGDTHFRPIRAPVPQAANSSSRWFFEKKQRRKIESKKRCIPDEFISHDLSARGDFSFREKRMSANSAPYQRRPADGETTTSED